MGFAILAVIAWGPARSGESNVSPSEPSSGRMKVHAREPESPGQKTRPVETPTPVAASIAEPVANPATRELAQPAAPSTETAGSISQNGTDRPPPPPPNLKLQAIFYHPNNPSVIISGKTLFRGDSIRGARILAIDKESVTLDDGGQQKVLRVR